MKHLFVINPISDKIKGREKQIIDDIKKFFESNPDLKYDIHVTRWSRDSVGYISRYVQSAGELVRVYAVGGTGMLFETVNGVIGLANAQVAFYPFGICNSFLRYFGSNKYQLFSSLRNLVFSRTTPIDVIRCGRNYGVCTCVIGLEAVATRSGDTLRERLNFPADWMYLGSSLYHAMKNKNIVKNYKVRLDGMELDGEYMSILIANEPFYGQALHPAVDAHPNDGILDIYLGKHTSKANFIRAANAYIHGSYHKYPEVIRHYTGQSISVSSDEVMCIALDGEVFYEKVAECAIIPSAIDFVCPDGIDVNALPRIFNRPEVNA